jgi:hypothetical protein
MVFYEKVLEVYSSWEEVGPQATGYHKNLHNWYKTREEANQSIL